MRGVFITATGTDAGKTFLVCGLVKELKSRRKNVRALKPVVSGYDRSSPDNDIAKLLAAQHLPYVDENIEAISLYRMRTPISPDVAARRESVKIEYDRIVDFCNKAAGTFYGIVEGAGGVMTPVADGKTNLDLILSLHLSVVLVGSDYLGSISHILTACSTLKSCGVTIHAVVISESEAPSLPLGEMAAVLRQYIEQPIVLLPRGNGSEGAISSLADMLF